MNQVYEEDKEETKRKFKTTGSCLQHTFAQLVLQFLSDDTFTETDIFFTAGYLHKYCYTIKLQIFTVNM